MVPAYVDDLGKCGWCHRIFSLGSLTSNSRRCEWSCVCGHRITIEDAGLKPVGRGGEASKKVSWLNQRGAWTKIRPVEPFQLGNFMVTIGP